VLQRQNQQSAGTRHEALVSDHRGISASGTHNLGYEGHENLVADACRLSHEDHHGEMHYGHPTDVWTKIWREQW
ncbi:hypothetical protein A2U01_0100208, partial [Trifolium medium]|nr:hypothetical protein [Trifolium medium]